MATEQKAVLPKASEIVFRYKTVLSEENIKLDELPTIIRKRINALKMAVSRYNANPTQGMYDNVVKTDIAIADQIQDWVERDLPDDDEAEKQQKKQAKENEPTLDGLKGVKPPKDEPEKQSDGLKKINAFLEKEGRIYHEDLKSIMGVRSLDDVVNYEGITLERSWGYYYKK